MRSAALTARQHSWDIAPSLENVTIPAVLVGHHLHCSHKSSSPTSQSLGRDHSSTLDDGLPGSPELMIIQPHFWVIPIPTFLSSATCLGTRTLAPLSATPHVNFSVEEVSNFPDSRFKLSFPPWASYTSKCSRCFNASFSIAASMC
jgi:hypothetical protein